LLDAPAPLEAIVIATGSEVALAADAVRSLQARGRRVRLVSMPSIDVFEAQDKAWHEQVLPDAVTARVAVEAGATLSWWRFVGSRGRVIGIDRFGASGKGPDLFRHYGLTADNVTRAVETLLGS
jgi:transketolase